MKWAWLRLFGVAGVLAAGGAAWAQSPTIPAAEALYAPTAQRLSAVHAAAQRDGWLPHARALREAALHAYAQEKLQAAEAWLNAYRWAALFAEPDTQFISRWIQAVNAAQVGHANMAQSYTPERKPLGAYLTPALQAWVLGNAAFSAEFFALAKPVDYLPRVFGILEELHRADPARFRSYASLALAIALVHDVPPPPVWPHAQVTPQALRRMLPGPVDAFAWWVKQDREGRTHHQLARLGAAELKFVIDAAAPFAELEWAQRSADLPLARLPEAYSMIKYRTERVTRSQPIWGGNSYKLADILTAGGICSDQAYFATQVGKARGVPTLLFYGAGNDGRHAWFGFLDGHQKWQLDAGRYAEQRFVTGLARDPQTWGEFSDHELKFLSERFRDLPSYRASRVHAAVAELYLAADDAAAAAAAARKAVRYEPRNQAGWEALMTAAKKEGKDARAIENLLREAALAFQRHPDLEAIYVNRVAESLRARGQVSAADQEVRRIAVKNQGARGDLSVQQAREIVQRAIATESLPGQIKAYHTVLDVYGRGAGAVFFDGVVVEFALHLVQLGQRAEAARAVERAQRTLRVEPGSQLEGDFTRLVREVKNGK